MDKSKWVLLLCFFFIWGCSPDSEGKDSTYAAAGKIENLIEPAASISTDGKCSVSISFTATGAWNVRPEKTWCKITPSSGEGGGDVTLIITAEENSSYDERNSNVTITCGDVVKYVTVTQKQKDAILLTSDKVEIRREGGEFAVEIKANVSFTSEVGEEAREWLHPVARTRTLSASTLRFAVSENNSGEKREGVIFFKSGNLSEKVTVYQAGTVPAIVLNEINYKIPPEGQDITIELQSNVEYTIQLPKDIDWIKEKPETKGMSTYTHHFRVEPNRGDTYRGAEIIFTDNEGISEHVRIVQYSFAPSMEPVEFAAFPGAEGHGKNTVGGRGGKVYHVTSLEDDGTVGTLRWALGQNGPKTIVFDVAGTIHLKSDIKTQKDYLTIAGQTSPGGICIADYQFWVNSNDVIIRFLRFRPGDASGAEPDGLGGMDKKNIIIDHCSVSWSVDECLSVYGMENSTVQWCLAAQALHNSTHGKGTHGYGGNWGGNHASYHHNMIAHCKSRVPRLGPRSTTQENEYVDIRNNVYYNWSGEGCYGGENQHVNIVNNYYKPGPATDSDITSRRTRYRIAKIGVRTTGYCQDRDGNWNDWQPSWHKWGTFYIDGNEVEGYADVTADNWEKGVYEQQDNNEKVDNLWTDDVKMSIKSETLVLETENVTTHSAADAYVKVLEYVGACNYRDAIDNLILKDVKNSQATCTASGNSAGLGYINTPKDILSALPELNGDPYSVLHMDTSIDVRDTDEDGMPDDFEIEFSLNPEDANDGNERTLDPDGKYTNLEMYLHYLVRDIVKKQTEGGIRKQR